MLILNSPTLYLFVRFHDTGWSSGSAHYCTLLLGDNGESSVLAIPALYHLIQSHCCQMRLTFQLGLADTGWKSCNKMVTSPTSHQFFRVSLLQVGVGSFLASVLCWYYPIDRVSALPTPRLTSLITPWQGIQSAGCFCQGGDERLTIILATQIPKDQNTATWIQEVAR